MTFHPGREARWQYADQTIRAIEGWNCSQGRGCVSGAEPGSAEHEEFGAGGTCGLLAAVFFSDNIQEMDDDGDRVTCNAYEQRPNPDVGPGQTPLLGVP